MNTKRILALVLALCVVFSLALPGVSFAENEVATAQHEHTVPDNAQRTEPTCVNNGSLTYTCPDCETYVTEEIPATGEHNYVDGVCSVCDAKEPETEPENEFRLGTIVEAAVAKIGDNTYATLAAAFDAAENGDEIVLLDNYTLPDSLVINKSVTLNLNGKTLTAQSASDGKDRIEIVSGVTVTLKGVVEGWSYGTIASARTEGDGVALIKSEGNLTLEQIYIQSNATCIWVKGGTLNVGSFATITSTSGNAIATNGSKGNAYDSSTAVINITDGTIKSTNDVAVYVPSGTFNITGGNITGATGVYMKGGSLNISGSIITGNGAKADYSYNSSGSNATGDALVIDVCGYPYGADPAISVTGGTFKSVNASAVSSYASEGYTAKASFLTGGEFHTSVGDALVATNYHLVEKYDAYNGTFYEVKSGDAADNWKVGDNTYEDFTAAAFHAGNNGTVKLLEDLNEFVIYSANQPITIDMTGKTLNYSGSYTLNLKNTYGSDAVITITGGTVTNTGTSAYSAALDTDGHVVVKGGTFTQQNAASNALYVTGGPVTIEGGTFNGNLRVGDYDGENALTIVGGTFTVDPSAYVAEGYKAFKSGTNFVVLPEESAQAELKGVKYATVQAAADAAEAGDTVKLLKDVDTWLIVNADDDIILDLNGFVFSDTKNEGVIYNSGKVTIMDSSNGQTGELQGVYPVAIKADGAVVTVNSGKLTASETAILIGYHTGVTVNVNGGELTAADNAVIMDNGTAGYSGNTINVTGGTITGSIITPGYGSFGIYLANNDTLNISGGTITGASVEGRAGAGIVMRAGELNISGGTIQGLGAANATGKFGDSKVLTGSYGIDIDFESNYPGYANGQLKVNITGGTIKGTDGAMKVYGTAGANGLILASGGTFQNTAGNRSEVSADYIMNGYEQNDSGTVVAHTHAYTNVVWSWSFQNGSASAVMKMTCATCGDEQRHNATVTGPTVSGDYNVYSATAVVGEQAYLAEYKQLKTIVVTASEPIVGGGTYTSGTVVTLTTPEAKKWLVDGTVVSGKATSYKFVARKNVTVTVEKADADVQPTFYTTLTKTGEGKARFEAGWAMPNGYSVQSAFLYRATAADTTPMSQQQLLTVGKKASISLRTQYATYGANLSSASANAYNTMLVVTYKDNTGKTITFYSPVKAVAIR